MSNSPINKLCQLFSFVLLSLLNAVRNTCARYRIANPFYLWFGIANPEQLGAGTVIDGLGYPSNSLTTIQGSSALVKAPGTNPAPMAYVNFITFDRDFVPQTDYTQTNFVRVTEAAKENGTNVTHERLYAEVTVKEPGYMYIYLSNDNMARTDQPSIVEVYFDDFKVTQVKSPVIASNDYYPFGLQFNSYSRENAVPNKLHLFQDQEHVDDLGLNWDSYRYRNHQPDIGRFFNIDPMSDAFYYNSPYAFSENKVTVHREMEGLEAFFIHGTISDNSMWKEDMANYIMRELKPYFSTEQTPDLEFKWNDYAGGGVNRNWLGNSGKRERATAARMLVAYILKHRKEGQEITLVTHSHGGNVAIQAQPGYFLKSTIHL